MTAMIFSRLRDLLIVLLMVGTAIFFIMHSIPGGPAVTMLGPFATQEQIEALNKAMGFDQPVIVQYFNWLKGVLSGDLGTSIAANKSVLSMIGSTALPTFLIATGSTILGILVSVPLAVRAAAKPRSLWARLLPPVTSFGLALPSFWLALMLVLLLAVWFRLLPVSGYANPFEHPAGVAYLVLPILVLSSNQIALFTATLREGISGELLNLYLRTARSKGLRERVILQRHVLRNALLPMITVVASSFGTLLGGAVIVESIFVIPGWGQTLYNAIIGRDYPLVIGLTIAMAFVFVLVNLIADLLYILVDPKVRLK